jgi:hypothetical protein
MVIRRRGRGSATGVGGFIWRSKLSAPVTVVYANWQPSVASFDGDRYAISVLFLIGHLY